MARRVSTGCRLAALYHLVVGFALQVCLFLAQFTVAFFKPILYGKYVAGVFNLYCRNMEDIIPSIFLVIILNFLDFTSK